MKDSRRILELQEKLDLGLIKEEDLSDEDYEKICLLQDEQTLRGKKKDKKYERKKY